MGISRMRTISDQLVTDILDLIVKNDMKPGDKMPSERELAELFEVGRPSIREAVRALSILNIIDIRQADGLYVASMEPEKMMIPYKFYMKLGLFDLKQLFELRLILEVAAAGLAAERISDGDLGRVEEIVSGADVGNANQFAEADTQLHKAIYNATGNFLLKIIMLIVSNLSSVSRKITGQFIEVRQMVHTDHLRIVEAMKVHDVERCKEAMRQHIVNLEKVVDINDVTYREQFLDRLKKEITL